MFNLKMETQINILNGGLLTQKMTSGGCQRYDLFNAAVFKKSLEKDLWI